MSFLWNKPWVHFWGHAGCTRFGSFHPTPPSLNLLMLHSRAHTHPFAALRASPHHAGLHMISHALNWEKKPCWAQSFSSGQQEMRGPRERQGLGCPCGEHSQPAPACWRVGRGQGMALQYPQRRTCECVFLHLCPELLCWGLQHEGKCCGSSEVLQWRCSSYKLLLRGGWPLPQPGAGTSCTDGELLLLTQKLFWGCSSDNPATWTSSLQGKPSRNVSTREGVGLQSRMLETEGKKQDYASG